MRGTKAMVLAVALVVSAAAVVGVGTTQSWFSDTETTDITITTAPLFTLNGADWDGTGTKEGYSSWTLISNYSTCRVSIVPGAPSVTITVDGTSEQIVAKPGILLEKGVKYNLTSMDQFSLSYTPGDGLTISITTGGTS